MSNEELGHLERLILEIAIELGAKKRSIELDELFKTAVSQLQYPEENISKAIQILYQQKFLVEGLRLTKENILENEKRKQIYEYIGKNPGAHKREIRNVFNIGSYMAFRHLKYLEIFGFLRSKEFMNKKVYFPIGFDETRDEKILVLKNIRTKQIFDQINSHKKVRLSELEDHLNLKHGQIQPHIRKLLEFNLINSVIENNIVYYTPPIPVTTEVLTVKREYDYIGGNIRFKIALQNNTNMSISNISVTLNPSEQFFWDETYQTVANLPPYNSRGVDFILTPNSCGKSTVFGAVSYQDAFGNPHTVTIIPKEIAIKCPLVIPQSMSKFEIDQLIQNLKKSTTKINYGNVSQVQAFDIALKQLEALDLSKFNVDDQNYLATYSGKVKVTDQQIVVKLQIDQPNIIMEVWAKDLSQTTGLLAFVRNLIANSLEQLKKTLEKSEEVVRRIIQIFNYTNGLKECFYACCKNEEVKVLTDYLRKFKTDLEEAHPESKALNSINEWISKLNNIPKDKACIDKDKATNLEYEIIDWLRQAQELITHNLKLYKESYENFNDHKEIFKKEEEDIKKNLEIIEKYYGLSILNYVIVTHKENGLSLYQQKLGQVELDADLISGFVTAIQSFGTEVSRKETAVTGLKYENYNIEIENGDYIRVVILLNGKANPYLVKSLFNFVKEFEKHFEKELKSFLGNISVFEKTDKIFHRVFGISE